MKIIVPVAVLIAIGYFTGILSISNSNSQIRLYLAPIELRLNKPQQK